MVRKDLPEGLSLQELLESIRRAHSWLMERPVDKSLIEKIDRALSDIEIAQTQDLPDAAYARLDQIEIDLDELKGKCQKHPKTNNTEAAA